MKQIFRKIATIAASALMIGSTAGFALAANYPAPFVQSGAASVAVVYGAHADLTDVVGAANIGSNLATALAAQTAGGGSATEATVSGGDSYKIERSSTKFQLGKGVTDIVSGTVTSSDLPVLLADGKYLDSNNDEYDFTQKIVLANNSLAMFDDSDYKADTPSVGIRVASGSNVLNYTVTYTDNAPWNTVASTDILLLGKKYFVLSSDSPTNTTLTLLDSAQTTILAEGESSTLTASANTYECSINFIGQTTVKLTVNGETTTSLAEGQTYKLKDGSFIGIKDILYNAKDTGISKVEFSIGSGKLKLVHGSDVEMNDNTISGLKATIGGQGAAKITSLTLAWNADGDQFAADATGTEMPGFKAVKLSFGGMSYPTSEEIVLEAASDSYMTLKNFPLKSATYDINLLYTDATPGNITGIGKDANNILRTVGPSGASTNLTFDADTDSYFVLSWNDTSNAESYLMKATNFKVSNSINKTTIQYRKADGWATLKEDSAFADTATVGNVGLTIGQIDYAARSVVIKPDSGVTSNILYSKEGMRIQLPYQNATNQTVVNNASCTTASGGSGITWYPGLIGPVYASNATLSTLTGCYQTTYKAIMTGEDKNGNIGASGKSYNASIGFNSASNPQIQVADVEGESVTFAEQQNTKIWESYIYSALATQLLWDKTGDQYDLKTVYHGGESFGNLYVTSPEAVVSATEGSTTTGTATELGSVTVSDAEAASVTGKNLIVVGGSCINSVAAQLLGSAACSADFTSATGIAAGEAIIKSFDRSGKVALLVAGYNAADTTKAVTYLTNKVVDTTVGKALKVTSATEATAIAAATA